MKHEVVDRVVLRWVVVLIVAICVCAFGFHGWKHYQLFYSQELAKTAAARRHWHSICENGDHMVNNEFVNCDRMRERKDVNVRWYALDLTFQHLFDDMNPFREGLCATGSKCDFLFSWTVTTLLSNLYTFLLLLGVLGVAIVYAFVHYTKLRSMHVQYMRDEQQLQQRQWSSPQLIHMPAPGNTVLYDTRRRINSNTIMHHPAKLSPVSEHQDSDFSDDGGDNDVGAYDSPALAPYTLFNPVNHNVSYVRSRYSPTNKEFV